MCCLSLAHSLRQTTAVFSLLQMCLSSRHCFYVNIFSSPLKQNPNHSGLCFFSKKSLKMEYLKCPWGKFERETLICLCGTSQSTFFWWAELPAMHARQVLDLIRVPWASSASNPTAKKKRARTTFILGKGQQKKVQLCMQTWISLCKWSPLFMAKFHLQWISTACD